MTNNRDITNLVHPVHHSRAVREGNVALFRHVVCSRFVFFLQSVLFATQFEISKQIHVCELSVAARNNCMKVCRNNSTTINFIYKRDVNK